MPEETLFTKIINREIPADIIYEDDQCLAFKDIAPQAPFHALVIPKKLIPSIDDLSNEDQALVGHLMLVVRDLARENGLKSGYRVAINCGADGGQTVDHLHLHIMGGRSLTWPPG